MISETDKEILNQLLDKNGIAIPGRTNKDQLVKRGYYDYIINRYTDREGMSIKEILYRMRDGIDVAPICSCGNPVRFSKHDMKYSKWCSRKCQNSDPEMREINARKISEYRKWEYANKKDEVMAKKAATLKEHYGEDSNGSPFCCKAVQDKVKQTSLDRFGTISYRITDEDRKKSKDAIEKKNIQMWKERGFDVSYTDHKTVIVHNGCPIHGDVELGIWDFNNRMKPERRSTSPICPICNPISQYSGKEIFLSQMLDSLNIDYIQRDRTIIKPLELDFVLKAIPVALEFNGVYYHNEFNKPNDYHINKTVNAYSKGYRVIHIWEDVFDVKKDIIVNDINKIVHPNLYSCYDLESKERFFVYNILNKNKTLEYLKTYSVYSFNDEMLEKSSTIAVYESTIPDKDEIPICIFVFINEGKDMKLINITQRNDVIVENCLPWFISLVRPKEKGTERNLIVRICRDFEDVSLYEKYGFSIVDIENTYRWVYTNNYWTPEDIQPICDYEDDEVLNTYHKNGYYRCYDSGTVTYKLILKN